MSSGIVDSRELVIHVRRRVSFKARLFYVGFRFKFFPQLTGCKSMYVGAIVKFSERTGYFCLREKISP